MEIKPMSENSSSSEQILDQFEERWKAWLSEANRAREQQPVLAEFLAGGNGPKDQELAWELFKQDLYYRQKAGEPPPLAERYFNLPGFELTDERKRELAALEERWRLRASPNGGPECPPGTSSESTELQTVPLMIPIVALHDMDRLEPLGEGGMGKVYRCPDEDLERDVALKVLHPRLFPRLVSRFLKEAKLLARLEHPGIVPIHSLGFLPDGRPFFTMKEVRGETLAERLAERKSQDLLAYIGIFEQICQTLAFAHARGVLHRDLKPANVMVGEFGEIQVMDWGLGKFVEPDKAGETRFSPNGEHLASASFDKTIKLWNAASGRELHTFVGHADAVARVVFSPDGKRLASASWDRTIKIWETTTGKALHTLSGHTQYVHSVTFSPNGTRLASAGGDVKVWDAINGKFLLDFEGGGNVVFSPDGQRLASGGAAMMVWESRDVR